MTSSTPRRSGRRSAALAVTSLACLTSGCAQDPGVLARVNQQAITVAQFTEVARGNPQQNAGPPDSAKAQLLRDLVDRELLVQGARAVGLDQTPEFQVFRRGLEDQVLRETLYRRLLAGPYPVSDAETRALYERRGQVTRARLIFTHDEAQIREAAKDLARGEAFAVVADRFNPSGQVPPGGDIGFIQAGSLLSPLDELVRTGAPGENQGPIAAGSDGWFIVRVEERRPEPQPPLDEVRAQLIEMLRQRKQRADMSRAIGRLRTEHRVQVMPGAAQMLSGRLRPVPGAGVVPQTPPPPSAEERARVLARHQGGVYTLGEAYDELIGGGGGGRIDFAVIPSVERWIESQTIDRAALTEARRRRIEDEPAVKSQIRERLNNYLLEGYYQSQVIGRISIGPGDFRAAYDRYRPSLVRLRSARIMSVALPDSAAAAALAAVAADAPSLRDASATAGIAVRVNEETVAFPADSPRWTQFEVQITAMGPGEIAGPFPTEDGWLIFQLREKKQDAPSFEDLPPSTLAQLQGVASEIKREARLSALTDSLRQVFAPVVRAERLRKIPWPPAPAAPPGS